MKKRFYLTYILCFGILLNSFFIPGVSAMEAASSGADFIQITQEKTELYSYETGRVNVNLHFAGLQGEKSGLYADIILPARHYDDSAVNSLKPQWRYPQAYLDNYDFALTTLAPKILRHERPFCVFI